MKKEKKKSQSLSRSIRTLLAFCAVVLVLILGSLSMKAMSVLKESRFDGVHRFTLLVEHNKNSSTVLSFDPQGNSLSQLFIESKGSMPDVGKYFGIPIDGKITDHEKLTAETPVEQKLLSYVTTLKAKERGLTTFDVLRLWLLSQGLQKKDIETKNILINASEDEGEVPLEMFVDNDLANEKVSVEIVNATGITGRGSKLERMLTNMGIPVVQVTTAAVPLDHSSISYADESTYTLQKLKELLGFRSRQMTEEGLSDIIIIVGRDSEKHPLF